MSWKYFSGIDSATGGQARTKLGKGGGATDDFAIATLRAQEGGVPQFVDCYRANGLTDYQMSAMIHRRHLKFQYEMLMMDPGGGGLFVRDKLREPDQFDGRERFNVRPLITKDDEQMLGQGDDRLVLFGRSDSRITGDPKRQIPGCGFVLTAESLLPNKMHELMRAALEATPSGINFPPMWGGWNNQSFSNADDMRKYLMSTELTGKHRVNAEIDLALAQLVQIARKMNPDMTTIYQDKFGFYEFKSPQKKDSAYALIYAYFAFWLWRYEQTLLSRKPKNNDKLVIAVDEA